LVREQRWGGIVAISSAMVHAGSPGAPSYLVSGEAGSSRARTGSSTATSTAFGNVFAARRA
jgi:hypothetical protein